MQRICAASPAHMQPVCAVYLETIQNKYRCRENTQWAGTSTIHWYAIANTSTGGWPSISWKIALLAHLQCICVGAPAHMQRICARAASHMRCSSSSHAAHMRWSPSSPRGSKLSGNLTGEIYLVIICYPFDLLFRFAEAFADHYRGSLNLKKRRLRWRKHNFWVFQKNQFSPQIYIFSTKNTL